MKYAAAFFLLGALMAYIGRTGESYSMLAFWPASCCVAIAVSYLFNSPVIFGKLDSGRLNPISVVLLLPYLAFTWFTWHLVRLVSREPRFNQLSEQITIGRRLVGGELPTGTKNVIDLTAEFAEPRSVVENSNYYSLPILDASTVSSDELTSIVTKIDELKGSVYIHCAQGHGRTGFVTAALLIHRNPGMTVDHAIRELQQVRPALACSQKQIAALKNWQSVG